MPEEFWANAVFSLIPTILVGAIFWFVMRAIFRADRTERKVYAQVEAEERARMGMPAAPVAGADSSAATESDLAAGPAPASKPSA
ncbi:MAG: hypothetical protein ABWY54_02590 [Glaciihabitans sp.]